MESEEDKFTDFGPIKTSSSDVSSSLNIQQPLNTNTSSKKTLILIIVLVLGIALGGFFLFKNKGSVKKLVSGSSSTPTPTPASTPAPTETPKPVLNRSDWSFEIQNGSGATSLAKKVGDKIKDLGYIVLKTGNADKSNYPTTQVLVRKELADKINLVIADLKDVIKIASFGGELKDSTASARIILGKDSI